MARPQRMDHIFDRFTFGGRVPGAIGLILAVTIVTSLVAAFGSRHVSPLFELGALVPEQVFQGQLWRLLTWPLLEPSPLGLIFGCLLLYWFGKDLAREWGSRGFLAVYVGITAFTAVVTCLLALVDEDILRQRYLGGWPLAEAITIAWGLWFPDRVIRIYFVLPIKGIVIAWLTVALTIVWAIYAGWERFVPSLVAEAAMLAWIHRAPALDRWKAFRRTRANAARQQRARKKSAQRVATVHVLHALEEKDEDLPPLPPEMEGKLGQIIEDAARAQRKKREDDKSS